MDLMNDSKCKKTNCDTKNKVEQGEKRPPCGVGKSTIPAVPPVLKNVGKLAAGVAGMPSGSATENKNEEPKCPACQYYQKKYLNRNPSKELVRQEEVCNNLVRKPKCAAINSKTQITCNESEIYANGCTNFSTTKTDCSIKKTLNFTNLQRVNYKDILNTDEIIYTYDSKKYPNNDKKYDNNTTTNYNNQLGNNFEAGTSGMNSYKNVLTSNIYSDEIKTHDYWEYEENTNKLKNTPQGADTSKNKRLSNNIDLFNTVYNHVKKNNKLNHFETNNPDESEENNVNHTQSTPNTLHDITTDLFSESNITSNSGNNLKKIQFQYVDLFNYNVNNGFDKNEVLIETTNIDTSKSAPLFTTNQNNDIFDKNRKIDSLEFDDSSNFIHLSNAEEIDMNIKYNPFFIKRTMIGINNCKCKVKLPNGKYGTNGGACVVYKTPLDLNVCRRGGNPRNKTALQPGHSLMDWIRLSHSGQDLTGVGPRAGTLSVSPKQLAEHNTESDAWIAIRGKVYNITAYFDFHPGGKEELMKGAGQDATQMFNAVHPWVNYESILQKCLVGRLTSAEIDDDTFSIFYGRSNQTIKIPANFRFKLTPSLTSANGDLSEEDITNPKFDWEQQWDNIKVLFYTKPLSNPQVQVTAPTKDNKLDIIITYNKTVFTNHLNFSNNIHWPCTVNINWDTGKIEVNFRKIISKIWDDYGTLEQERGKLSPDYEFEKIKYIVLNNVEENYNTRLIAFQRIDGVKQTIPLGYHIKAYGAIDDQELIRYYTGVPCCFMREFSQDYEAYRGDVCLLIKSYPKGLLSPTICASVKGDVFELSPPLGDMNLEKVAGKSGYLVLAAGTGISPMLGIMKFILESTKVKCEKLYLLYFNQKEEDIILHKHFNNLVQKDNRVVVKHVLSKPSKNWTGLTGHIDANLLKATIDEQCSDTQLFPVDIFSLICGPLVFANLAKSLLLDIGYTDDNIHLFGS